MSAIHSSRDGSSSGRGFLQHVIMFLQLSLGLLYDANIVDHVVIQIHNMLGGCLISFVNVHVLPQVVDGCQQGALNAVLVEPLWPNLFRALHTLGYIEGVFLILYNLAPEKLGYQSFKLFLSNL